MLSRDTWELMQKVKQRLVEQPAAGDRGADLYEVEWTVCGRLFVKAESEAQAWQKIGKKDDLQLLKTSIKAFDFGVMHKVVASDAQVEPERKPQPVIRSEADETVKLKVRDLGDDIFRFSYGALVRVWAGRVDYGLWVFKVRVNKTLVFARALDNVSAVPVPTTALFGCSFEEVWA